MPEVGAIVDLDRSIYVWLVLKKLKFFLVIGSWRWQRAFIVDNTVRCQNTYL